MNKLFFFDNIEDCIYVVFCSVIGVSGGNGSTGSVGSPGSVGGTKTHKKNNSSLVLGSKSRKIFWWSRIFSAFRKNNFRTKTKRKKTKKDRKSKKNARRRKREPDGKVGGTIFDIF